MSPNEQERIVHPTFLQRYLSLSPQHPIRFIGLCAQVFFYYLAYGYLQVS